MRVLLDENLPHDLMGLLVGHAVETVAGRGWAGVRNGELLKRASGEFDVFLTMDRRLPDQQRIAQLPFGVILLLAHPIASCIFGRSCRTCCAGWLV